LTVIDAPKRGREPGPNPHVAELRALFAAACRFGITSAERDEWQVRFEEAIAALEALIAASEVGAAMLGAHHRPVTALLTRAHARPRCNRMRVPIFSLYRSRPLERYRRELS